MNDASWKFGGFLAARSTRRALGISTKFDRAKKSVRKEILAVIKPFKTDDALPQLSSAELSVMAILCADEDAITDKQISNWIVEHFRYYEDFMKDTFAVVTDQIKEGARLDYSDFRDTIRESNLNRADIGGLYDLPIKELYTRSEKSFEIDANEGRVYLRNILEPKREGTFRFLDLPVEIRLTIYEYVLRFPSSGLGFCSMERRYMSHTGKRLLIQREEKLNISNASVKRWGRAFHRPDANPPREIRDNYLLTRTMNEILAIVSVNKQIYEEAMPYFYRYNHFHVDNVYQLAHMLAGCGPKRRQHFTSISFWYGPDKCYVMAVKSFRLLAEIKNLRFLQIEAEDDSFPTGPPSIKALKKTTAQTVEFIGECAKIEVYLKEAMEKPNVEEEAVPKKRKRGTKIASNDSETEAAAENERDKPTKKQKKVAVADSILGHWVLSGKQKTKQSAARIKERQEDLTRLKAGTYPKDV